MARLDDAISHLACAIEQTLPCDDAILVGHMRDALALLRAERSDRNDEQEQQAECDAVCDAADDLLWRTREQADRDRDDAREQLLYPVRNRNEYEGREDFEE